MNVKDLLAQQSKGPETQFKNAYERAVEEGSKSVTYWAFLYNGLMEQGRDYLAKMSEPARDGTIAASGKDFLQLAENNFAHIIKTYGHETLQPPIFEYVCSLARYALQVLTLAPSVLLEDEGVGQSYQRLIAGLKARGANEYADDLLRQLEEAENYFNTASNDPEMQGCWDGEKPKGE